MCAMAQTIIPVILCGGSGTRLWPASREQHPKQFLQLVDDYSLLQNTMLRALRISGGKAGNVVTVTLGTLADKVHQQLSVIDPAATNHILCEPSARNTAAAVAYAAVYIKQTFGDDTLMWILPADHYIGDEREMTSAFQHAVRASGEGFLVTFGINPTRPETGYGYIRLGKALPGDAIYRADSFVEKPDAATATAYLAAGNYLWNSGMFLFSTDTLLAEYDSHAADILEKVRQALERGSHLPGAANDHYGAIPEAPFDKAIMEKSSRVAIIPCNPDWSDIGSWESLWEIRKKDMDGNVIEGNAVCHGTRDCLIHAQKRLVACAGVENLVVIETGDALLVANRSDAESMRSLVKALKKGGYAEMARSLPIPGDGHAGMTRTLPVPPAYIASQMGAMDRAI
jgi:mannose-1-phosphate guanylyltransferase/mannose-6-phosphate isomerase